MTRLLLLVLFLVFASLPTPAAAQTGTVFIGSNTGDDAAGTPCTEGQPCTPRRALITMDCENDDVLELLDGTYQGVNFMLDLAAHVPGKSGTDNTHRCTVRARNDGAVVIDGQFARPAVRTNGHDYWTFRGFDAVNGYNGNANASLIEIFGGTGLVFQRICASDLGNGGAATLVGENVHMWSISATTNGLFEDICGFGIGGRNILLTDYQSPDAGNTFRRIWARHDGYKGNNLDAGRRTCQANTVQLGYHDNEPYTSVYENLIVIFSYDQIPPGDTCYSTTSPTSGSYEPALFSAHYGQSIKGLIGYTTTLHFPATGSGFPMLNTICGSDVEKDLADIFIDTRTQKVAPFGIFIDCASGTRLTGIRTSASDGDTWDQLTGSNASDFGSNMTNTQDCTTLGACPNFYTGDSPGTGSRSCFEYEDGTLTATPLWPWPMDDRIKAAIARAGKTALAGSAGPGYAANTVTSEIVSRYGAVPETCLRDSAEFVPDFPEVDDFPATAVLDYFDRANGAIGSNYTLVNGVTNFNVASNVAVANSNHQRVLWDVATFPAEHEVFVEVPTVPTDGTAATVLLIFGSTALDDDHGWQLLLGRPSGGHDTLMVARIVGGYAEILGPIDLGGEVTDGDSFGVRVDPPSITVYWKYAGTWYEVGSVTDANLPSGGVYIGFGGVTSESRNDFGGGGYALTAPTNLRLLGWFDAR